MAVAGVWSVETTCRVEPCAEDLMGVPEPASVDAGERGRTGPKDIETELFAILRKGGYCSSFANDWDRARIRSGNTMGWGPAG